MRDADAHEGGDFLTPPSVARVMAGALAAVAPAGAVPTDPYCRTGELLTAYLDVTAGPGQGEPGPREVRGRVLTERALRLARMNVRVHGGDGRGLAEGPVTPALSPYDDLPAGFEAVITNPPFGGKVPDDVPPAPHWTYGRARRTEFDWLQYVVAHLAPEGRAAVLMPGGAAFQSGTARIIREGMVADGVVECVMALPAQLFAQTAIRTYIWFLRFPRFSRDRTGKARDVLFVDGGNLGHSVTRTRRALSSEDIGLLAGEYTSWCRAVDSGRDRTGTPGLSRVVTVREIVEHDHLLDPARYVRPIAPEPAVADPAAVRARLARLSHEIGVLDARARAADADAAEHLRRYGL